MTKNWPLDLTTERSWVILASTINGMMGEGREPREIKDHENRK